MAKLKLTQTVVDAIPAPAPSTMRSPNGSAYGRVSSSCLGSGGAASAYRLKRQTTMRQPPAS